MPAQDVANISMVSAPNLSICDIARNILRLKPKTSTHQITIMEVMNGMVDLLVGGITFCGDPLGSPCKKRTIGGFVMNEVETLATLVLGGAFDATELGDNEIYPDMGLIDALQQKLVTGFDDVSIELISRSDLDSAQTELAVLRLQCGGMQMDLDERDLELAALREELDQERRATLRAADLEEKILKELQQRLTAANERADVLEGLVGEVLDAIGREPLDLDAVLRLRALLDAPAKAEFSIPDCPDCACVQDGQCLCIPSKPAAQPQGEPVAEIVSKYGDPEAFGERELITLKDISKFPYGTKFYTSPPAPLAADIAHDMAYRNGLMAGFQFGISGNEEGYAESLERYNTEIHQAKKDQPVSSAPVSVVLSDRAVKDGAAFSSQLKVNGWNDYDDEFKRLNPSLFDKVKELNQ